VDVFPTADVMMGGFEDGVGKAVFAVLLEGLEELGADGGGERTDFFGVELEQLLFGSPCTRVQGMVQCELSTRVLSMVQCGLSPPGLRLSTLGLKRLALNFIFSFIFIFNIIFNFNFNFCGSKSGVTPELVRSCAGALPEFIRKRSGKERGVFGGGDGVEGFTVFAQANLVLGKVQELDVAVSVGGEVPDDKAGGSPFLNEGFQQVGGDILTAGKEGGKEQVRLAGDAPFAIGEGEQPSEGEPAGIRGEGVDFPIGGDGF